MYKTICSNTHASHLPILERQNIKKEDEREQRRNGNPLLDSITESVIVVKCQLYFVRKPSHITIYHSCLTMCAPVCHAGTIFNFNDSRLSLSGAFAERCAATLGSWNPQRFLHDKLLQRFRIHSSSTQQSSAHLHVMSCSCILYRSWFCCHSYCDLIASNFILYRQHVRPEQNTIYNALVCSLHIRLHTLVGFRTYKCAARPPLDTQKRFTDNTTWSI